MRPAVVQSGQGTAPRCFLKGAAMRIPSCCTVHFGCRYLSWDDYFMAVAFLSAQRSKDPNKQASKAAPAAF